MKKVFKYRKKLRLEQNQFYLFKLLKQTVSPDGNEYYVVVDPIGNKHLIPVEYYSLYNLEIGKSYLCKVDKINCLGRVFIEPPHPIYKENKSYLFGYLKIIKENHKLGYTYSYYQFRGENGYNAFFDSRNFKLPQNLKSGFHYFRILKISKGKVYIDYC